MQEPPNLLVNLGFYIGIFLLAWFFTYTQGNIFIAITLALVIIGGSEVIATIFTLLFYAGVNLWKRIKK